MPHPCSTPAVDSNRGLAAAVGSEPSLAWMREENDDKDKEKDQQCAN